MEISTFTAAAHIVEILVCISIQNVHINDPLTGGLYFMPTADAGYVRK